MNIRCTVNETYRCVVGESLASGLTALLVRFSGCNLSCAYCDTRYACDQPGQRTTVDQLAELLKQYGLERLLLTGGEPLMQPEAAVALCDQALQLGCTVLLESNGTLPTDTIPGDVAKILDVKTPGAEPAVPFLESNLGLLNEQDQLKFVVTSFDDCRWALDFLHTRKPQLDPANIIFSPASPSFEPPALAQWLLQERLPYRFQIQLHKALGLR